VIVSLVCAGFNAETTGGSKGLSFAAVWSALLVIAYAIIGSVTVYSANGTDYFTIGNLIGMGAMLAQLFFVLMWVYYILGQGAAEQGLVSEGADNAMGSICFFNFLIYSVWTIIMVHHRTEMVNNVQSINQGNARSDGTGGGSAAIDGDDYED
jgi:heme A synthase